MIIGTARDAADLLEPCFAAAQGEVFAAAYLGPGGRLIRSSSTPGNEGDVAVPLRQLIGEAITIGAEGLIVAHNHPGGDPNPSQADLATTRLLAETAASLGIRLHDHLIFGGGDCRSMRALGLL